ncbi:hypothetical protein COCVIDRAFT_18234 [Bipolaris victoriae FI3]|uniref:Uncharacterized protein n=1 Tax=Bipolaris victoriae (strain FI3) TaxID=930091 RepID=W7EEP8_BIPV3|nr:hypothetical protein COCVIDRAFT_18234 [Bipolaris victoriae FI3]
MSFANINKASWAGDEDAKVQGLNTAWKSVYKRNRRVRHMSQSVIAGPKVGQGRKPNRKGSFIRVQGSKGGSEGGSGRAMTPRLWDYPGGYMAKGFGNDRVDGLGKGC